MTDKPAAPAPANDPETLARVFHYTYERLAPQYGYETRADTKEFDPASPNGRLMIAVCAEISNAIFCSAPAAPAPECQYAKDVGMPEYRCVGKCQYAAPAPDDLAVSAGEILASLRFLRTHLYAAQAQAVPGDDTIIMRHVYDAYKRVSDVCKEVELHGIAHPAAPAPVISYVPIDQSEHIRELQENGQALAESLEAWKKECLELRQWKANVERGHEPAASAPSATVDEVMALAHRMKDAAIGWGDVYTAMQTLRAAVEQIVRERDAERDGRDAMDSAARCNHAAYEKERKARLRAEQEAAALRKEGK